MANPTPTTALRDVIEALDKATPGHVSAHVRPRDASVYMSLGDHTKGPHAQGDVYLPAEDAQALAAAINFLRTHGRRALAVMEAVEAAPVGEAVEVGDDDQGQPRVLIHSTRDELRKGPPLAFRKVRIVLVGEA